MACCIILRSFIVIQQGQSFGYFLLVVILRYPSVHEE
jgi:hypothetical protein